MEKPPFCLNFSVFGAPSDGRLLLDTILFWISSRWALRGTAPFLLSAGGRRPSVSSLPVCAPLVGLDRPVSPSLRSAFCCWRQGSPIVTNNFRTLSASCCCSLAWCPAKLSQSQSNSLIWCNISESVSGGEGSLTSESSPLRGSLGSVIEIGVAGVSLILSDGSTLPGIGSEGMFVGVWTSSSQFKDASIDVVNPSTASFVSSVPV